MNVELIRKLVESQIENYREVVKGYDEELKTQTDKVNKIMATKQYYLDKMTRLEEELKYLVQ